MSTVLVALSSATLRQLVKQCLSGMGHNALVTTKLDDVQEALTLMEIDLMVVGEMCLRQWEGESWWRPLGHIGPQCPVLYLLGDKSSESLVTLREGRDRVLAPPFSFDALHETVGALLRGPGQAMRKLRVGEMELDPERMKVACNGYTASLTKTQFRLLHALAERQGQIVPAEDLAQEVWGNEAPGVSATVLRSHIYNLRERIRGAIHRDPIRNVPRRGYCLQV